MGCNKTVFVSLEDANKRVGEINSENAKTKKQLRPYRCDVCGNWHLTSMTKHAYRYNNSINYRNKINEKSFIKRESEHWEKYFGID